ncbi:hypothetical protein J2855_004022 [Agrobacterium tumefaciens]|nr:hypothetical protein [Agrobacterium tumefaciens]MBP2519053.1 hypothetical protein [Agrobacterium tumefaciens]MBP2577222.1 hypothetical protein [Agrobacterium tumefaciens]MBP2596410.1 hypothetical protein [Agrobacterium tumefaciens]
MPPVRMPYAGQIAAGPEKGKSVVWGGSLVAARPASSACTGSRPRGKVRHVSARFSLFSEHWAPMLVRRFPHDDPVKAQTWSGRGSLCREQTLTEVELNKFLVIGCVGLCLTACTSTEKGAGIGAATGAVVGGAATGNVRGAAVGAAIGGVSGALIGNVAGQPGRCYYRDSDGNRYVDRC